MRDQLAAGLALVAAAAAALGVGVAWLAIAAAIAALPFLVVGIGATLEGVRARRPERP